MNDLVRELQDLRVERGDPSLRDLATLTGVNRQSLSEAFTGRRLPSWSTVEKIVAALDGDSRKFKVIWRRTKGGGEEQVTRGTSSTDGESIACFLSYSHDDDVQMEFASKLKSGLEYFAMATRGRTLTVFLDKKDIRWGEDWRITIRESVLGATVFMPVITYTYFQSPFCREELLLYYQNAQAADVVDLILPIVVFGHGALTGDNDDEVARIIGERQYKDLNAAFMSGTDSALWRKAMLEIANSLVDAVDAAEQKLATALEPRDALRHTHSDEIADDDTEDYAGLSELSERAQAIAGGLTTLSHQYVEEMNAAAGALKDEFTAPRQDKFSSPTLTLLAARVEPMSKRAAETGRALESRAAEADTVLRQALDLMELAGMNDARLQLIRSFEQTTSESDLVEIEKSIGEMSNGMLAAEVLSVALRKALRPLRGSLKSVQSAAKIIDSWSRL